MNYFLIAILILQSACQPAERSEQPEPQQVEVGQTELRQTRAERRPLTRVPVKMDVPATTPVGERYENGRDRKSRVVVIDENAGKYELQWIGIDGKRKVIKYQRNGAIDVLVSARVERIENRAYRYIYTVRNLPSSGTRLSGFTVQTFVDEVLAIRHDPENMHTGLMSDLIRGFEEGKWWRFSLFETYKPTVKPGESAEFILESAAPPGFVGCKADGGDFGTKGAGEDPPPELERLFLGTRDWPYGYTIGPVDKLTVMTKVEKSQYVLDNLFKFVEAGWMAGDTPKIYEAFLKREDLAGALKQARRDLENEFITSEVFHIIEGLAHGV